MKPTFLTRLLDVVMPRTCAICGGRLTVGESVICSVCHLHLPMTGHEQSPLDNPLARLFWGQFPIERAAAFFYFEPHAAPSRIIYDMKYHDHPEIAHDMGMLAARHFAPSGFFDGIEAIIPLPITRKRQWQRGYNQSSEIARGVSSVTGIPILKNVVRRTKFSQSQTTQRGQERLKNVEDAFLLTDPQRIAGRHILLIDDIVTTGATVIACGRELSKATGVSISVMSLGLTKT